MQGEGKRGGFFNLQPPNENPGFMSSSTSKGFLHGYDHNNYSSSTNFSLQNPIQTASPQVMGATPYGFWGFSAPSLSTNVNQTDGEIISNPSWPTMRDIKFADGLLLDKARGSEETERRHNEASTKDGNQEVSNGKRSEGQKQPLIKGHWTKEEDRLLIHLVNEHGDKRWTLIAKSMKGRAGKQCRERWHNHLRPNIKTGTWSEEEEAMLVEAHRIHGNKWSRIAKRIPGRTENNIKNHWNVALRRLQNSPTEKTRKIFIRPPSTPLERYIISLNQLSNANPNPNPSPEPSPSSSPASVSTTLSGEGSLRSLRVISDQTVLEASRNCECSDQSPPMPVGFPMPMQYSLMNESSNKPSRALGGADNQVGSLDGLDGMQQMQQDVVGESSVNQNMMMITNDQAPYCPTFSVDNGLLDDGVPIDFDYQAMSDDVMMLLINHQSIP